VPQGDADREGVAQLDEEAETVLHREGEVVSLSVGDRVPEADALQLAVPSLIMKNRRSEKFKKQKMKVGKIALIIQF
jgi:hypothetical protein